MPLRRARPADARAIAELHVATWKAAYPGLLPRDYLEALTPEDRLSGWEEALASSPWPVVLVAESGRDLLGVASLGPSADEGADGSVGEVQTLYVGPATWHRGVGTALLEEACRELAGAGFTTATLWVLDVNERARRFYEGNGWRPDGATKEHDWVAFVATDVRYARALEPPSGTGRAQDKTNMKSSA